MPWSDVVFWIAIFLIVFGPSVTIVRRVERKDR